MLRRPGSRISVGLVFSCACARCTVLIPFTTRPAQPMYCRYTPAFATPPSLLLGVGAQVGVNQGGRGDAHARFRRLADDPSCAHRGENQAGGADDPLGSC
jgi:hypothetical protein